MTIASRPPARVSWVHPSPPTGSAEWGERGRPSSTRVIVSIPQASTWATE